MGNNRSYTRPIYWIEPVGLCFFSMIYIIKKGKAMTPNLVMLRGLGKKRSPFQPDTLNGWKNDPAPTPTCSQKNVDQHIAMWLILDGAGLANA